MKMVFLLTGIAIILAGGLAALLVPRRGHWACSLGSSGVVAGCVTGLIPAVRILLGAPAEVLHRPWSVPYGSFHVELDALSAFFLIPILLLCALAAIYGIEYLRPYRDRKSLGASWFFFSLLVASMILVTTARNIVLFLVAWEVMSLASFFLVTFEHEDEKVSQAGWTYLVATHLGTLFLLAMFALLGSYSGSPELAGGASPVKAVTDHASLLFILAIVGFGTKAGFMPFHVWLPEAHPAAPSHVSAVMSGVMIKTGIYGLVRTLTLLGPPPAWWGWLLIGIGLVSGVLGVLFALAQHDLKRLLAYHSVENIGIIAIGLGVGLLGLSLQSVSMAVLGFGGGLLHVLNHACFKGLLFLGAGSVLHATGSREIDRLGGLLKRMPWTGWTFLVGAAAIAGLPPLNGFVSELLIYLGSLEGVRTTSPLHLLLMAGAVAGLALIGGLALACFAKAFGVVFLGEARSAGAAGGHECGWLMRVPMLVLAAACVAIGLLGPLAVLSLARTIAVVGGMPENVVRATIANPCDVLIAVVGISVILLLLTAGLIVLRRRLLADRVVSSTVTWDCGYARPTARMQYTASSFAQPLTRFFQPFLRTRTALTPPVEYFPPSASFASHTDDVWREKGYSPVFRGAAWAFSKLRWLQHGRVQTYVLYIAVTLLALLLWKLR
ncbi:MAG: hypothetical protein GX616_24960 [Planctomycetes bacterium]|nr:hypothetical protein [Planctomycetota bacterium]